MQDPQQAPHPELTFEPPSNVVDGLIQSDMVFIFVPFSDFHESSLFAQEYMRDRSLQTSSLPRLDIISDCVRTVVIFIAGI